MRRIEWVGYVGGDGVSVRCGVVFVLCLCCVCVVFVLCLCCVVVLLDFSPVLWLCLSVLVLVYVC